MNKILRISVFMLLTLVSSLTFAKVIFDAKADKMQKKSITKDGVVVSVCKGELNNGKEYRIHKGDTIQISANRNISTVVFNCTKAGKTNYGSGNFTTTDGEYSFEGKMGIWKGNTKNISLKAQTGQVRATSITVYFEGESADIPSTSGNAVYKKATKIESGKNYLIIANVDGTLKAAKPLPASFAYGYLKVNDVTEDNHAVTENRENAFTIEASGAGYTIKASDGRYLYQDEKHNSFQIGAKPTEGQIWTIAENMDGTFKITNTTFNKYIQFSTQYNSYGSYKEEQGIMPMLYVEDKSTEPTPPTPNPLETKSLTEFIQLKNNTQANLKLTDAKVVYVDGKNIYLREGNQAIMLFNTNLSLSLNSTISGEIALMNSPFYGVYEAKDIEGMTNADKLTITPASDQTLAPITVEVTELAESKHIAHLVSIKDVKIVSEVSGNYTNFYAITETGDKIQLHTNNKSSRKNLYEDKANDGKQHQIIALFNNIFKGAPQIDPVQIDNTTGINTMNAQPLEDNAPMYNLAGQRVDKTYKGVVIQNGKKFIKR